MLASGARPLYHISITNEVGREDVSETPFPSPGRNDPNAAYDGPPDYRVIGRHAVFPETSHDEIERINFLAQMNRHLAARVVPGVKASFENRVAPGFAAQNGRPLANRHEARKAMLDDPAFQTWSALRRMTMEQRQQAGRWTALRQNERLARIAADLTDGDERLALDPTLPIPRYVSAVDHHCMPGSYHTEYFPGDVTNGANYDHAGFVTTSGLLGKYSDAAGMPWSTGSAATFRISSPARSSKSAARWAIPACRWPRPSPTPN